MIGSQFAAFDEFEEGRDDGDFFVGGDEIEDFGVDDIDSGELVGTGLAVNLATDIGDAVAFHGEMKGRAVALNGEGCGVV